MILKYNKFINESRGLFAMSICKKYGIENYKINYDGTVDVNGNVNLFNKKLTEFPLKFGNIIGHFQCMGNSLTSLIGSPIYVSDGFDCSFNKLTSLEGCPKKVGAFFDCSENKITSLEGMPKVNSFDVDIYCYNNNLRDVKGIKSGWRGVFRIEKNPVHSIFKLFPQERWDEVVEYLNEYDVIRDGDKVILQALEMIFVEMCLEVSPVEYLEGSANLGYELI
jgi:hypothetical protein